MFCKINKLGESEFEDWDFHKQYFYSVLLLCDSRFALANSFSTRAHGKIAKYGISTRSVKRLVKQTSVEDFMVFFLLGERTSYSTAASTDRTSGNKETHWLVVRFVSIPPSSLWYCLLNVLPFPGYQKASVSEARHPGYRMKVLASRRLERRVPMFLSSHREIRLSKTHTHTHEKRYRNHITHQLDIWVNFADPLLSLSVFNCDLYTHK